ncbi:ABC transporter permease [Clostridium sp. 19966]|uniref:ABC transporter permease n=1 Tax=Clostridium sp. 19966 TaxID=2768166 RepID=UPI0028DF40B0|nr:ABC transporter permease [Clostridium sp. 19966]MDT8715871.1 ABC transporter permease [Clostridium sp. 19966]
MYWIIKRIRNSKLCFVILFSGFFISMLALCVGISILNQINRATQDHSNGNFKYVKKVSLSFTDDYEMTALANILKENFISSDVAKEFIPIQTQNYDIMLVTGILPKDKYLWVPPLEKGSFINGTSNEKIAVVGSKITNGIEDNNVNIGGKIFKIVGTCGKSEGSTINKQVFIPINYIPEILGPMNRNNAFDFVVKNNKNPEIEINNFKKALLSIYSTAAINVTDDTRIATARSNITRGFQSDLKDIWKLLLINIFNIINISYFWIHFRRKEISLRKVLGASKLSLYALILKEILFICLLASFAAAILLALLNKLSINLLSYEFTLSFNTFIFSIFISLLTCVFTAVIPARIAFKVQPAAILKE